MRSETPEAPKSAGRVRAQQRWRSAAATRRARLRGPALESLEERCLLATIPTLVADPQVPIGLSGLDSARNLSHDRPNPTGSNSSSPQIAVDPNDPNKLVAVWTTDGIIDPFTTVQSEGAFSIDGGKTWKGFDATPVVFIDPA